MPTARAVAIANAVVAQINAANLGITAQRSYADWDLELADESGPRCDVIANSVEQKDELATRGNVKFTVPIDIAIRQKFDATKIDIPSGRVTLQVVDDLILLTETIAMLFAGKSFFEATGGNWAYQEIALLANPIRQHLRQFHQFTSVMRLTFRTSNP